MLWRYCSTTENTRSVVALIAGSWVNVRQRLLRVIVTVGEKLAPGECLKRPIALLCRVEQKERAIFGTDRYDGSIWTLNKRGRRSYIHVPVVWPVAVRRNWLKEAVERSSGSVKGEYPARVGRVWERS